MKRALIAIIITTLGCLATYAQDYTPDEDEKQPPVLAIRTNILYDFIIEAPNLSIELPLGDKLSIQGGYMQPWRTWHSNSYAMQSHSVDLQLKYWLGERTRENRLMGHHVSLDMGIGDHDIQRKGKGYQGNYFLAGFCYGYTFTIGTNVALDLGLGLGMLYSDYHKYNLDVDTDLLMWQEDDKFTWLGPTDVHASLIFTIPGKKKQ